MRSRLKAFTKDMPGCRQLRPELDKVVTFADLEAVARRHNAEYMPAAGSPE